MERYLESLENFIGAVWDHCEPEHGQNSAYPISIRDMNKQFHKTLKVLSDK